MLLGIGIDILSIARLEGMIARRGAVRLAMRICSQRELVDFHALREKFDSEQLPGRQLRFLCARYVNLPHLHLHPGQGILERALSFSRTCSVLLHSHSPI